VRVSSCQIGATVLAPLPRAYVNAAHCARFCALPSLSLSLTLSRFSLSLWPWLSRYSSNDRGERYCSWTTTWLLDCSLLIWPLKIDIARRIALDYSFRRRRRVARCSGAFFFFRFD